RLVAGSEKIGWLNGLVTSARSSTLKRSVSETDLVMVTVWVHWLGPRSHDHSGGSGETTKLGIWIQTFGEKNGFSGTLVLGSMRSPSRSWYPPAVTGSPMGIGVPLVSLTLKASPL